MQRVGCAGSPGTPGTQVPPTLLTETTVTTLGRRSWITTLVAVDGPPLCTVSVYVMFVPATSGSGASLFVRLRSETARMLTPSHASSFAWFGSGVSLETLAQSLTSCASVAVNVTTIVVRPPAGSVPRSHVTTPPALGHAPPGLAFAPRIVKEPLLTCVSVTTTLRASEGPRLSTRIVHVAVSPASIGPSGLQSFVTRRSARSSTIVDALALLLSVFGSITLTLETSAVFVIPIG